MVTIQSKFYRDIEKMLSEGNAFSVVRVSTVGYPAWIGVLTPQNYADPSLVSPLDYLQALQVMVGAQGPTAVEYMDILSQVSQEASRVYVLGGEAEARGSQLVKLVEACPQGPIFDWLMAERKGNAPHQDALRTSAPGAGRVLTVAHGPVLYSSQELRHILYLFVDPTTELDFPDEDQDWDQESNG